MNDADDPDWSSLEDIGNALEDIDLDRKVPGRCGARDYRFVYYDVG